ncbi:MAG: response regulator [Pseudomarimonas sp.]
MNAGNPPRTVLAVDDEPNILAALRRLLRSSGFRILTAGNAEEALAQLADEPIDAVLSDMRMPGMNGVQLLELVSLGWPRTARLLLTGEADLGAMIDAINRGGPHCFITKPWNDHELVLTLRQLAESLQLEADETAAEQGLAVQMPKEEGL